MDPSFQNTDTQAPPRYYGALHAWCAPTSTPFKENFLLFGTTIASQTCDRCPWQLRIFGQADLYKNRHTLPSSNSESYQEPQAQDTCTAYCLHFLHIASGLHIASDSIASDLIASALHIASDLHIASGIQVSLSPRYDAIPKPTTPIYKRNIRCCSSVQLWQKDFILHTIIYYEKTPVHIQP